MEHPPSPAALWVQWQSPGDASVADHLAVVLGRQQRQLVAGVARPWIVYVSLGTGVLVVTVAAWPGGIVVPILIGLLVWWAKVLNPRQVAKAFRNQQVAHEPTTVTLDAEGFHAVTPSVATHLRWSTFESATIDEEVLVLRRRGVTFFQLISLATLDPGVDRGWLLAEVQRAIEADAPPVVP